VGKFMKRYTHVTSCHAIVAHSDQSTTGTGDRTS
jgi:hypothetical protein